MVSVLSYMGGSRGIDGACAQNAFSFQLLLLHEGEHVGVGFKLRRPPAKQQGPGSQRQPSPSLANETQGLGAKKASVALLSNAALGLWFDPREESNFPECSFLHGVWSRD